MRSGRIRERAENALFTGKGFKTNDISKAEYLSFAYGSFVDFKERRCLWEKVEEEKKSRREKERGGRLYRQAGRNPGIDCYLPILERAHNPLCLDV